MILHLLRTEQSKIICDVRKDGGYSRAHPRLLLSRLFWARGGSCATKRSDEPFITSEWKETNVALTMLSKDTVTS